MVIDTQAQSQTASVPLCIFTCKTHTLWKCSEDYMCPFPITSVAPYKVNPWKITIGLGRILLGWGQSKPSVGIIGIRPSSVTLTQVVVQGAHRRMVSAITTAPRTPYTCQSRLLGWMDPGSDPVCEVLYHYIGLFCMMRKNLLLFKSGYFVFLIAQVTVWEKEPFKSIFSLLKLCLCIVLPTKL